MKFFPFQFFITLAIFFIPSCSLFSSKTYTWDWRRDHPLYQKLATEMILKEAPELLEYSPSDIDNYCPQYKNFSAKDRLEFWGLFLSVISWMESSHRTEHFYEEVGIIDSTGENVISRGLLQFSYESAQGYLPSLNNPQELHKPSVSLRIGAIALRRFIIGDGVISEGKKGDWKGAARYWSVLRRNAKHTQIQEWLNSADYQNPKNNLIPPPPHVTEEDYEPWIKRVFKTSDPAEKV